MDRKYWESVYLKPISEIPWEIVEPPVELSQLIDGRMVIQGRALDIGCGTGNYSIYLAEKGFEVTGVDISGKAISIATERARGKRLEIHFIEADVLRLEDSVEGAFDFILDYSILHHIPLEHTKRYAEQFTRLLSKGGKLLLVCYSEKDGYAEGKKVTKGKLGNTIYYRHAEEIRDAYQNLSELDSRETRLGKALHHVGLCFLFTKR
jgi:2-polyprenyl-3-methyl-5-hydroxy-6-metoxy-1,4-benzoquinol methylase